MFYRRETFQIHPKNMNEHIKFFDENILPVQIKSGAKLVGSWVTDDRSEHAVFWEYPSEEEYIKIDKRVKNDPMFLQKYEGLYSDYRQEFLTQTGKYDTPLQNVTVSGYITNEKNETLLVKTSWRSDTYELPGGGVDFGETLDMALCREILEETGIETELSGVTGVYSNGNTICVVFRGKCIGGALQLSDETKEVMFVKLTKSNVSNYIKRGKFVQRITDAMKGRCVPHEAFKVRPYELIKRIEESAD
ncbi:NUDIX hydrolase [Bacillus dakarensis]|uniref:NUDIX hydrolase n=1 Tax=Robertmurraya dakarensis TaxID=1926278 RepID=UPI000980B23A|nr:NUDIX hydrolase [Bacillus dakarensis]